MDVGTSPGPRRVMVVADPTSESAAALQYVLSHGRLTDQDELILLNVGSSTSWRNSLSTLFRRHSHRYHQSRHHHHHMIFHSQHRHRRRHHHAHASVGGIDEGGTTVPGGELGGGYGDFLEEMKSVCEVQQPTVRVRIERVENKEGKERASMILHQSASHGADVLVIGQRRSLSTTILGRSSAGRKSIRGIDTAEYLIKHSNCTCVAVQRKGQNEGYLLNTKTCRNFWLLA